MNIGVLAFGFMGRVHCEAYHNIPNARGVAVATRNLNSVTAQSKAWSNLEGVGKSRL